MKTNASAELMENHTFDEIRIGDSVHLARKLSAVDMQLYAAMSGNVNVACADPEREIGGQLHGAIAHGMWGGALISTVIGNEYPGPGTIYIGQSLRFVRPLHVGNTLDIRVTVATKDESNHHVTLDCCCTDQDGAVVITGDALVMPPNEKVRRTRRN